MDKRQAVEFLEYLRQDRNLERTIYGDALNIAIEALKAQLSHEGTTKDAISRQQALDAVGKYASVWMEYTDAMSKDEIAQIALNNAKSTMIRILKKLPTAQPEVLACGNGELVAKPEPTDIDAKEAVYNLAEKIGIHQLFALTVELRGEPIQPEPHEGHWIGSDGSYICSECNGSPIDFIETMGDSFDAYMETPMPYCPNCGAKMTISK